MSPRWLHWPAAAPSGPTLVAHDTFSGSGGLSGRTPDTVDNGNTWTTYNGETYTVSSGTTYAANDNGDFSKAVSLDLGASSYTIQALLSSYSMSTASRCGLVTHFSSGTDGSETFAKIDINGNSLRLVEYSAGSATVTTLVSSVGLSSSTEYWFDAIVAGSSITVNILNSSRSTTIATGSTTASLSSSSVVGINLVDANSTVYCSEYKAYV